MDNASDRAPLLASLREALLLLEDYGTPPDSRLVSAAEPLPSLLAQCEALSAEAAAAGETADPVRTLHHFACAGGTLLAKCIAGLPNVVILSEIDPLSRLHLRTKRRPFFPTDIIADLRVGLRPVADETILAMFRAGLAQLRTALVADGRHLVIRDHAHSQFCTADEAAARPTLREIVQRAFPVRSVVTLRHPIDSFMSLDAQNWRHFSPFTLDEYAVRYLAFLDAYAGVPRIRYEDFVAAPETVLEEIASLLALPFEPAALQLMAIVPMTGDSGRSSTTIAPRPRRAVSDALREAARASAAYIALCAAMGYDADLS